MLNLYFVIGYDRNELKYLMKYCHLLGSTTNANDNPYVNRNAVYKFECPIGSKISHPHDWIKNLSQQDLKANILLIGNIF